MLLLRTLQEGKFRSMRVYHKFHECGHESIAKWISSQNVGGFQSRCFNVGATQKGTYGSGH